MIPGQGTKIPHAARQGLNKEKEKEKRKKKKETKKTTTKRNSPGLGGRETDLRTLEKKAM